MRLNATSGTAGSGLASFQTGAVHERRKIVTYELTGDCLVGLNVPDTQLLQSDRHEATAPAIDRAGEEAKCGIIFGHGDNFAPGSTCAGGRELEDRRSERLPFQFNRNSYFEAMARGNIPFVAALHGATLAGAETGRGAHCVADETTYFGPPEGTRGISSAAAARCASHARSAPPDAGHDASPAACSKPTRPSAMASCNVSPRASRWPGQRDRTENLQERAAASNSPSPTACRASRTWAMTMACSSNAWWLNTPAALNRLRGCTSSRLRRCAVAGNRRLLEFQE